MKYHMVNTRKRWGNTAQKWMLSKKVVMACYKTCEEIEYIEKDDLVLLYENSVGIIAIGTASGEREVVDFEGDKNAGMMQKLSGFRRLKTPIQAATISAVLRNFAKHEKGVFCKTRVEIPAAAGKVLVAIGGIV